jgi:hypothetical protein
MSSFQDPRFVVAEKKPVGSSLTSGLERWSVPLLCLLFVPLFMLILLDRRVWPWDDAYYGEYSVWLFQTLVHAPLHWPEAMLKALVDRAPAIAWLGQFFVPFGKLLPYTQSGLLCSVLATQLAAILCLFALLKRLFADKLSALLSCCIAASGPLFTGLTYHYLVEPIQLLSVVWPLILCAYYQRLSRPVLALQTIAAIAFGLLAKTSTPLFQFPALLYLAYVFLKGRPGVQATADRRTRQLLLYGTVVAAVLLVSGTLGWYLVNFQAAERHVNEAASGGLAIYYGSKGTLFVKLAFWLLQFRMAFFWPPLFVALGFLLIAAVFTRWTKRTPIASADVLTLLSAGWILVVLLIFSRNINEDTRYLLPLLPYVTMIVCWAAANGPSRKATLFLLGLALLQFAVVTAQAYGAISPQRELSAYLQPYISDDKPLKDTVFAASNTFDSSPGRPTIVGEELPEFNAVGLSFYGAIMGHSVEPGTWSYIAFDWTLSDPDAAWQRIAKVPLRYYALRKYDPALDNQTTNRLAKAEFDRVSHDPGFRFRPDKSNERVLVYERTAEKLGAPPLHRVLVANPFRGVEPQGQLPFGLVDYPQMGTTVEGRLVLPVYGWVASPSEVDHVTVAIDGGAAFKADRQSRPDVIKTYPKLKSTGYRADLDVAAIPDGDHRVTVTAFAQKGPSRVLADFSFSIHFDFAGVAVDSKKPFGLLEFPRSGMSVPKTFGLVGWTVVPSGLGTIEIVVDGHHLEDAGFMSRPDVHKVYPSYSSYSGFKADVDLGSAPPGPHRITVISHGKNALSQILGQVTVIQ